MRRNVQPRKGIHEESTLHRSPKELKGCDDGTDTSRISYDNECMYYENENLSEGSNLSDRSSRDNDTGKYFTNFKLCLAIILFMPLLYYSCYDSDMRENKHELKTKSDEFKEKINNLRKKYQNQDENLWISFNSGITSIQTDSPPKPSVFLLLQRENYRSSECLVREMAESAMNFLDNPLEPIFVYGNKIKQNTDFINDYGHFLKKFQSEIERKQVMVVFDLQDIPPVTAQAFHHLCDEFNPLVKEAVYVFTLQVSGEENSPSKVADRVLTSLWNNTLSTDKLDPLMVRIADRVLLLQPEHNDVCP